VLVIQSLGGGGAERVTTHLSASLVEAGHEVAVATFASARLDAYPLHPDVRRIDLSPFDRRPDGTTASGLPGNARRIRALRRTLRAVDPDVAVAMMTTSNVLLAMAAVGLRCATVGSERVHPPQLPLSRVWEGLRWFAYRGLDALVVLTGETADWARRRTLVRRTEVIPNPVVWPIPVAHGGVRPEGAIAPERRVLLAVGRLENQKGFDLLLDAYSRIAADRPDWDLVIVGEGTRRDELVRRSRALGLGGRVHLPGRAGDVEAWYRRADVFVLSSRFEGFPNTLVEAMACGRPVVSFACPTGPADIVRDGVDGLLVPAGDVAALGDALLRLADDPALRARLGAAATDVRARLSPAAVLPRWDALLRELAARPSASGAQRA
jgi:glycosyltransferase involved in cell wall biosynthesis